MENKEQLANNNRTVRKNRIVENNKKWKRKQYQTP
jgi:hypothetical protein